MSAVVKLAEVDDRPYVATVTLLTERTPNHSIRLKAGEELFVVAANKPVQRPGYVGPDEVYCIGADIGGGEWPVMLIPVQVRHSDAWVGIGAESANRMIQRARNRLSDPARPKETGT